MWCVGEPGPGLLVSRARHDQGDPQVTRGVQDEELPEDRAHRAHQVGPRSADAEHPDASERDRARDPSEYRRRWWSAAGPDLEPERCGCSAGADAHLEGIIVVRASLPQVDPRAGGDRQHLSRIRERRPPMAPLALTGRVDGDPRASLGPFVLCELRGIPPPRRDPVGDGAAPDEQGTHRGDGNHRRPDEQRQSTGEGDGHQHRDPRNRAARGWIRSCGQSDRLLLWPGRHPRSGVDLVGPVRTRAGCWR
jgi:hypothetical protein